MPFEQNGVMWEVNITNPSVTTAATVRLDITLSSAAARFQTVGTWVYRVPQLADAFPYVPFEDTASAAASAATSANAASSNGSPEDGVSTNSSAAAAKAKGVMVCGQGAPTPAIGAACSRYVVSGDVQPDTIAAGSGSNATTAPNATWAALHVAPGGLVTIRISLAIGGDAAKTIAAAALFSGSTATWSTAWGEAASKWEARWQQVFTPDNGFWSGSLPVLELDADQETEAMRTETKENTAKEERGTTKRAPPAKRDTGKRDTAIRSTTGTETASDGVAQVYYMSILTVVSQARTNLPLIHHIVWPNGNGNEGELGGGYMGIGGSRSWWWDEALTSMMLALLEPDGRAPTYQVWLAHDDHAGTQFGHGMGNGYAMDCDPPASSGPFGSNTCGSAPSPGRALTMRSGRGNRGNESGSGGGNGGTHGSMASSTQSIAPKPTTQQTAADSAENTREEGEEGGPQYGFYCYNPWAYYMAMSNHARVNNASSFLAMHAANNTRGLTVDDAMEIIVQDYREYLMPGTHLVDYGPNMDGFSPTYKHTMAGCSQGNNVWMLRDWASRREAQGKHAEAAELRTAAKSIVKDTMTLSYESKNGHGWFNVLQPLPNGTGVSTRVREGNVHDVGNGNVTTTVTTAVVSFEMRHVVDMFSVTFGFCGLSDQPCDLSSTQRKELAAWFKEESVTSTWIRATSPQTNCSVTKVLAYPGGEDVGGAKTKTMARKEETNASATSGATTSYPGLTTCSAGRPDHGTNGAYPSWPAFSVEALCYLEGDCASAFSTMATFAANTREGPFGQSSEAPQLSVPPYTPLNDEASFKPIAGVNRYVAIEGGSFFDAVVRGFFGYHAPLQWGSAAAGGGNGTVQAALDAAIVGGGKAGQTSRGFAGKLRHLRTPFGLATITSGASGLRIALE